MRSVQDLLGQLSIAKYDPDADLSAKKLNAIADGIYSKTSALRSEIKKLNASVKDQKEKIAEAKRKAAAEAAARKAAAEAAARRQAAAAAPSYSGSSSSSGSSYSGSSASGSSSSSSGTSSSSSSSSSSTPTIKSGNYVPKGDFSQAAHDRAEAGMRESGSKICVKTCTGFDD